MFKVIQEPEVNSPLFAVIEGEVAPAGYPIGKEGFDWKYVVRRTDVVTARRICEALNKADAPKT
jgi:hypothetical protein